MNVFRSSSMGESGAAATSRRTFAAAVTLRRTFAALPLVLALMLALCGIMLPRVANAAEIAEGEDWQPTVTVTYDKESYDAGEVALATVTFTNDHPSTVRGVTATLAVPEGLTVVQGSATKTVDSLAADETLTYQVGLAKQGGSATQTSVTQASDNGSGSNGSKKGGKSLLARMGDTPATIIAIVAALGCTAVVVGVVVRRRRGRGGVGGSALSVMLVLALAASGLLAGGTAWAEEDEEALPTAMGSASFVLGGTSYETPVTVTFTSVDEIESSSVSLSSDTTIEHGAEWAHITVTAEDGVFVQGITADDIELSEGLEGWQVDSVSYDINNPMQLTLAVSKGGADAADAEDAGLVSFKEGCFVVASATGSSCVAIGKSTTLADSAAFVEDPDLDKGQGYVQNVNGQYEFVLPVSLGYAEAGDKLTVSFPDNEDAGTGTSAITVMSIDYEPYASEIVLHLVVQGDTARDQFNTLDEIITNGGIQINNTNAGTLTVYDYSHKAGAQSSALSDVATAVLGTIDDVSASEGSDGEVTVSYSVQLKALGNNVSDEALSKIEGARVTIKSVDGDSGDGCSLCSATTTVDSSARFIISETMSAEEFKRLTTLETADDLTISEERALAWSFSAHKFTLAPGNLAKAEGVILDSWGIPQDSDTVSLAVGIEASEAAVASLSSNDISLAEAGGEEQEDYENTSETISKSMECINELLKGAGEIAGGIAEENIGEVISGGGSLFGFLGKVFDASKGETVTLQTISQKIDTVNNTLNSVDSKVSGIYNAIDKGITDLTFKNEEENLNFYVSSLNSLASYINNMQACMSVYDNDNDTDDSGNVIPMADDSFPYLTGSFPVYETSSTGEKVIKEEATGRIAVFTKNLDAAQTAISEHYFTSGTSIENVTTKLAFYIAPTSSGATTGRNYVKDYFDYLDTCYNWSSETLAIKQEFLTKVLQAYVIGYSISVAQVEYEIMQKVDAIDPNIRQSMENEYADWYRHKDDPTSSDAQQAKKEYDDCKAQYTGYVKKVLGENTELAVRFKDLLEDFQRVKETYGEDSALSKRALGTDVDPDKTGNLVENYVTGTVFNKNEAFGYSYVDSSNVDSLIKMEPKDMTPYSLSTAIDRTQFETMAGRVKLAANSLPTCSGVTSILDELGKLGFNTSSKSAKLDSKFGYKNRGHYSSETTAEPHEYLVRMDSSSTKSVNESSMLHEYEFHGDAYDISSVAGAKDAVKTDRDIYYGDRYYKSSKVYWCTEIYFHAYGVVRAAS